MIGSFEETFEPPRRAVTGCSPFFQYLLYRLHFLLPSTCLGSTVGAHELCWIAVEVVRGVRRTESVVHVNVCQSSQLLCKAFVALFPFRMETQVFQQQHFARFEIRSGFFQQPLLTQSSANLTGTPNTSDTCFTMWRREYLILYLAVRDGPDATSVSRRLVGKYLFLTVGTTACMRVSSVMLKFSSGNGTLKSTRHDSLLPLKLKSLIVFI